METDYTGFSDGLKIFRRPQRKQTHCRIGLGRVTATKFSVRVTVSEMGPMLPARSMNLNDFEKQVRASVFASNLI
ncbi:helicase HerA-like domain-containing protein [uncultured Neisseria sp.]|uniref:helicase HerA-like domain-containing protein n=1 Tax=uncultured Neisseria sp. TaxID=237778 RepID=UPI00260BF635|nr:helicase HerA-like domain-containing protein [uncultured Neisseria sp.]